MSKRDLPTGKNRIRTADPILRELFVTAYQRGITVKEVARRIGRTPPAVSRWRSGATTPSMIDVVIIAEAIGCKIVVQGGVS